MWLYTHTIFKKNVNSLVSPFIVKALLIVLEANAKDAQWIRTCGQLISFKLQSLLGSANTSYSCIIKLEVFRLCRLGAELSVWRALG